MINKNESNIQNLKDIFNKLNILFENKFLQENNLYLIYNEYIDAIINNNNILIHKIEKFIENFIKLIYIYYKKDFLRILYMIYLKNFLNYMTNKNDINKIIESKYIRRNNLLEGYDEDIFLSENL